MAIIKHRYADWIKTHQKGYFMGIISWKYCNYDLAKSVCSCASWYQCNYEHAKSVCICACGYLSRWQHKGHKDKGCRGQGLWGTRFRAYFFKFCNILMVSIVVTSWVVLLVCLTAPWIYFFFSFDKACTLLIVGVAKRDWGIFKMNWRYCHYTILLYPNIEASHCGLVSLAFSLPFLLVPSFEGALRLCQSHIQWPSPLKSEHISAKCPTPYKPDICSAH